VSRRRNAAPSADQWRVTASDAERWRELTARARPGARPAENNGSWYRISNAAGTDDEVAVIDLYDEIGYWGVSAADFVAELRAITAGRIEMHVNSPGGQIYDGLAIYTALLDHEAHITVKVDGIAASAASFIAQAGDRVVMAANAELMIHDGLGLCIGNAALHREMADLLDKASDNIASIYAARAGNGTVKAWRARMEAETWYSASEAVEAGLADEAVKTPKRTGDTSNRLDTSMFTYPGRADAPDPEIPEQALRRRAPEANGPAPSSVVNIHVAGSIRSESDLRQLVRNELAATAGVEAPVAAPAAVEPEEAALPVEPEPTAPEPDPEPLEPAAVTDADEPDEDTEPAPGEPAPAAAAPLDPEPAPEPTPPADPVPVDLWADLTQHLTAPDQDDVFTRLKEALL
jgi:ATP-dependent protease ClpP protease subunit